MVDIPTPTPQRGSKAAFAGAVPLVVVILETVGTTFGTVGLITASVLAGAGGVGAALVHRTRVRAMPAKLGRPGPPRRGSRVPGPRGVTGRASSPGAGRGRLGSLMTGLGRRGTSRGTGGGARPGGRSAGLLRRRLGGAKGGGGRGMLGKRGTGASGGGGGRRSGLLRRLGGAAKNGGGRGAKGLLGKRTGKKSGLLGRAGSAAAGRLGKAMPKRGGASRGAGRVGASSATGRKSGSRRNPSGKSGTSRNPFRKAGTRASRTAGGGGSKRGGLGRLNPFKRRGGGTTGGSGRRAGAAGRMGGLLGRGRRGTGSTGRRTGRALGRLTRQRGTGRRRSGSGTTTGRGRTSHGNHATGGRRRPTPNGWRDALRERRRKRTQERREASAALTFAQHMNRGLRPVDMTPPHRNEPEPSPPAKPTPPPEPLPAPPPASASGKHAVRRWKVPNPFEPVEEAMSSTPSLEVENARVVQDFNKHAPEFANNTAEFWRKHAEAIREGIPVAPEYSEALGRMNDAMKLYAEDVAETGEVFERSHEEKLRKITDPAPNEHKWDILLNKD